jgi:hypothetical protein
MKPLDMLYIVAAGLAVFWITRQMLPAQSAPVRAAGRTFDDQATADLFASQDALFR